MNEMRGNNSTSIAWGLESSIKGKILWQIVCLSFIRFVRKERNVNILKDKWRTSKTIWDLIHFYPSF